MRRFCPLVAILYPLLGGCSEFGISPDEWEPDEPEAFEGAVDILLVLDNSCSMMDDWGVVSYGLTRVPEDAEDAGYDDWSVLLVSADPSDDLLVILTPWTAGGDPGWAMMEALDLVHAEGRTFEAGLAASLEHKDVLREGAGHLVAFVSDEIDQSVSEEEPMPADAWRASWGAPLPYVVGIVGLADTGCGDRGDGYIEVADRLVDVCTEERWSLF